MRFSQRTLAALAASLGAVVGANSEMDLLFKRHGLADYIAGHYLREKAIALVEAVEKRFVSDDREAEKAILDLATYALTKSPVEDELKQQLVRALALDGVLWTGEKLVPATPTPADLAPELSKLEIDLHELAFPVAAGHYKEAYENFVGGRWAAAKVRGAPCSDRRGRRCGRCA
jgi:hypothetical protein